MKNYYSKEKLYSAVADIKKSMGLNETEYGIDLPSLLSCRSFKIQSVPFKTQGLRGMAALGEKAADDVIILNSKRNYIEQNFDCGHENMHLSLHRNLVQKTFNCYESVQDHQEPIIEWQANEGSAEFFVPYKILIPIIKENHKKLSSISNLEQLRNELSELFKVPEIVIKYRIDNLRYEIYQHLLGIPIDEIKILSDRKQKELDIDIKSLNNTIIMEDLNNNRGINHT